MYDKEPLKWFKCLYVLLFFVTFSSNGFTENNQGNERAISTDTSILSQSDQIAVLNVISATQVMDSGKLSILTDIFRTELFKLNIFKVLDRSYLEKILTEQQLSLTGIIQDSSLLKVGEMLAVKKLFICTIEKFSGTVFALNVRIINLDSAEVDFMDNVFIKDENMIFDAIKEIIKNIDLHYKMRRNKSPGENRGELNIAKWKFFGANTDEIKLLTENNIPPEKYLELRQYDIYFNVTEFLNAYRKGWDFEIIKIFIQKGIAYQHIKKSLEYGIVNLTNYNVNFKPAGLRFDEYLDAYAKQIHTPEEYIEYKNSYKKDKLLFGFGGVANRVPIMNAEFKFPLLTLTWEHFFTDYQRGKTKRSIDVGTVLFNLIAPSPYIQYNWYLGEYPFYFKTGVGFVAEVILGGHLGGYIHAGVEIKEKYEFSVILTPVGTQPGVSYNDFKSKPGDPKYGLLNFPYAALVFKFK